PFCSHHHSTLASSTLSLHDALPISFVGPSGKLLDRALEEAGIERDDVYVTNAVKHFKWERGEKSARRIHKKPNDAEIRACHPWLDRKSTRLNSSHRTISYAVFCLKK